MKVSTLPRLATFTTKGQIVIPVQLRHQFKIKAGTQAAFVSTPEGILLKPITREYLRNLRGSLKTKKVAQAYLADKQWERKQ